MNSVLLKAKFLKVLIVCLLLSNFSAFAQKSTIWIVRHAEKDTSTGQNTDDPSLSIEGKARAEALAKKLKRQNIKAIYVTKFKRTGETARPLAVRAKILPRVYGDDLKKFAETISKNFSGQNVLVIGHSNTLMPLLDAFGAEMPFTALAEDDYDMLFKLTKHDSGEVELEITYYGDKHHSSEMPEKYQPEVNHPEYIRPFTNY